MVLLGCWVGYVGVDFVWVCLGNSVREERRQREMSCYRGADKGPEDEKQGIPNVEIAQLCKRWLCVTRMPSMLCILCTYHTYLSIQVHLTSVFYPVPQYLTTHVTSRPHSPPPYDS